MFCFIFCTWLVCVHDSPADSISKVSCWTHYVCFLDLDHQFMGNFTIDELVLIWHKCRHFLSICTLSIDVFDIDFSFGFLILMSNFTYWLPLLNHMELTSPPNIHPWSILQVKLKTIYQAFGMLNVSFIMTSFYSLTFWLQLVTLRLPIIIPSIPFPDASMMLLLVAASLILLNPCVDLVVTHVALVSSINTFGSSQKRFWQMTWPHCP